MNATPLNDADQGPAPRSWGVLGAGMLGLTLALRLAERGEQVTVLDAAPQAGGLASAWEVGGVSWDRYYHVISLSDSALLELIEQIGLADQVNFKTTRTNFFDGQNIWPLNNAFDYLRLPAMSLLDKIRVGHTILRASRIKNLQPLEAQSAKQWLISMGGKGAWQRLWRPLLRSKLGVNIEHASAAYMCSVIHRFYGARQGGAQREMFGYVDGGYARITEALLKRLDELNVVFVGDARVQKVTTTGQGLRVSTAHEKYDFDQLALTFASPLAARVCSDLQESERAALNAVRYQGIICASVLLKRALGQAYLTYITDESMPFTTVIEMSTLVNEESFNGHHLVYLPQYLPSDDPLFEQSDQALQARFLEGLKRMFPSLQDDDVLAVRTTRNRYVMAIPGLHYSSQLPALQSSVRGLWIANSAQIINSALTANESIVLANEVASKFTAATGTKN